MNLKKLQNRQTEARLQVYDSGNSTADRYTAVVIGEDAAIGFSDDCYMPNGFSQWIDVDGNDNLGKRIEFSTLPERVQEHVLGRLEEI